MNKIFNKVAVAFVGIAMAIGVGVAVGSNRETVRYVEASTSDSTAATSVTSGKKYFICVESGNNYVYVPQYGKLDDPISGSSVVSASIAKTALSTVTEDMCWTITSSSTSYTISYSSGGKTFYLGNTNTNNGMKVSETSQTWTIEFSGSTATITGGNSRKLSYYNSDPYNWRCYSSTSGVQSIKLFEYVASTYTVTYNANGGTGNVPTDATPYANGAEVTVKGNVGEPSALSKQYHTFSGWTLNDQGTGTVYGPGDGQTATYTIASANVTFYAKWVDTRQYIDISTSSDHLSLSGTTHVLENSTNLSVTVVAEEKYKLPTSITITGAKDSTWSYNSTTGVVSGLNVSDANVTISGTSEKASIAMIEVVVDNSEKSFYLGHEFTHSTAVVTGYYDDPYTTDENVTAGCTWSEPNMFTTGEKEITVTHTASGESDSYTISVSNKATNPTAYYARITSAGELTAVNYVIVYDADSVAMSTTQNTNNRGQTSVTISENRISSLPNDAQVLTLSQATISQTTGWQLYTGSGYLYAASSSDNHLKTQQSNNTNGLFDITFSSNNAVIKAKGSNTRNWLKYNSSSDIFSCYASSDSTQKNVQLYKCYPAVTKDLIQITSSVKSATRYIGDAVTVDDFNVTAKYDNGDTGSVTATALENATLTAASNDVTVKYTEGGITKSAVVTVSAEPRAASLTSISWSQAGFDAFVGDELAFSSLATVTASYSDSTSSTKAIGDCTVSLYSKVDEVYTHQKDITDGHAWLAAENGWYLGVSYTENAVTKTAYASSPVNVVATINSVYEQEPVHTYSRVTSINAGDVVTFVNETSTKVASGFDTNIITVSSYTTNVQTNFYFEVGKVGDYYTFHNANGYLGNHSTGSSGNNYAYLDAEIDGVNNQNYFTVTFDGNNVIITSVYDSARKLQFNGTRFCFYGSNQSVVQLYKGSASYSPTGGDIANTNATAQKAALDYVTYFNTTMACVNDGSTANVSTKWTAVSGEFTRVLGTLNGDALTNFKALFAYAYARGSDKYDDTDPLQDMLAKYNHIVSAHGVIDFLNADPINRPTAQYAYSDNMPVAFASSDSSTLIIVVLTSLSVLALGGYLLLRRKEN